MEGKVCKYLVYVWMLDDRSLRHSQETQLGVK